MRTTSRSTWDRCGGASGSGDPHAGGVHVGRDAHPSHRPASHPRAEAPAAVPVAGRRPAVRHLPPDGARPGCGPGSWRDTGRTYTSPPADRGRRCSRATAPETAAPTAAFYNPRSGHPPPNAVTSWRCHTAYGPPCPPLNLTFTHESRGPGTTSSPYSTPGSTSGVKRPGRHRADCYAGVGGPIRRQPTASWTPNSSGSPRPAEAETDSRPTRTRWPPTADPAQRARRRSTRV